MGRSYMLLISSPSMSLVVALLMMFVSDVLSQAELAPTPAPAPAPSSCVALLGCSAAEENALIALYTGWGILSPVGASSDPCVGGWEGVMCLKLEQPAVEPGYCYMYSVIGLELIGLGLRGNLSGAIGNLTNLQFLIITGNPGLTGNLPSEIGSLSNLATLDLQDNNFTGVIPNLARLANLEILFLNGNAFSGSIEPVFQGLNAPFLLSMDLSSNQLTGCIPGLTTGLGNFSGFNGSLLNVSHNHIGGYFNISNQFSYLYTLDLSFNNISGDISTLIFCVVLDNGTVYGPLCSIGTLLINNNHFSGKLPDFSTYFGWFTNLDLSNNQFSGIIPPSIWNISTNLTFLNLSGNNFSGNLPPVTYPQNVLETLSMSKNQLNGELPNLSSFPQLKTLDLSYNQFNGSISPSVWSNISKLNVLNLSNNKLYGILPTMDLQYCPNSLKSLNLGGNNLTGLFPSNLFNCSFMLQEVNFDNNNFNGVLDLQINLTKQLVNGTLISMVNNNIIQLNPSWESGIYSPVLLGGNPCCSIVASENPTPDQQLNCRYNSSPIQTVVYQSYNSHELAWILSTILPSFVLLSGIIFIIIYWKYHKNMLAFREIQKEFAKQQVQPILYSYNVLKVATKDFHPSNKLGEGGFGAVYKGILPDGTNVAVKLLNKSHQGVSEFLNEIVIMTDVRHKNLVKVKGFSLRATLRIIVFEYVENDNLAEALWGQQIKNVLFLDWTMRFNICVGIARGLFHLHEYLQPHIIHRDIKGANILLDKDLNPKIADFGLARLFPEDISHLSTAHIAGTMGYLSPEYATLGQLSEKVDVFSYGVLLLEIVSGRKNIDLSLEPNKIYLLQWACSLHEQDRLTDLIDQRLNNNVSNDEAQHVINVALLCVQTSATRRPSMSRVLAMLLNEVDVEVVSKKANRIHEMDVSHLFQSNSSLSPSGLI